MSGKRGAIHFEITASNEDIKRKLAETRQNLLNSGKTAEEQASRVHNAFNKVVSTVSNFGGVIAIGAATKELYDFANAFDNSMREVSTISSTVTDNIDSFKQQILELGTRVPIAADAAGKKQTTPNKLLHLLGGVYSYLHYSAIIRSVCKICYCFSFCKISVKAL